MSRNKKTSESLFQFMNLPHRPVAEERAIPHLAALQGIPQQL